MGGGSTAGGSGVRRWRKLCHKSIIPPPQKPPQNAIDAEMLKKLDAAKAMETMVRPLSWRS